MHTTAKQPSENASATKPANEPTAEEVLAQLKTIYRIKRLESEVTMIAAQTKSLETLVHCMKPVQTTGDTKLDAFYARERNRQRLAAIQTLLHIRTVQREKRMRRAMRAKAKSKAERREPDRASAGSQAPEENMPTATARAKGGVVRSEGHGHVYPSAPDSPAHGLRPIADRTQTMPPTSPRPRTRSRYKTRKPKRPKQPARRKR